MKYWIYLFLSVINLSAIETLGQYSPGSVEKLGAHINLSGFDEISPIVTPDGKTMYFTRVGYETFDRTLLENDFDISRTVGENAYINKLRAIYSEIAGKEITDPIRSNINQDIWVAMTNESLFDRIVHPSHPLNNALPNSVCGISGENGEHLIVINQFTRSGDMFQGFSKVHYNENLGWQFPEPIFIEGFDIKGTEVSLTSSMDEETIILSFSDDSGNRDMYVSFKIETNSYSKPMNLGKKINSVHKEFSPFLTSDKQFILFSSDRSDPNATNSIFISKRLDDTWQNWSEPVAFPSPINSFASEQHPFFNEKHMMLYFTSNRDGSNDVFRARIFPDSIVKNIEKLNTNTRDQIVESKKERLKIKVFNSVNNKAEASIIKITDIDSNRSYTIETENGEAEFLFDENSKLEIFPEKEGFFSIATHFEKSNFNKSNDGNYYLRLTIDPILQGTTLTLNPLHFQRGTDRLLPKSFPEIELVAELLKKNPGIKILVIGHTDSVGDKDALLHLSETRANTVKRLLENNGIESSLIETMGKGAESPLNDNSTEEKRAQNRRVEFIIQ